MCGRTRITGRPSGLVQTLASRPASSSASSSESSSASSSASSSSSSSSSSTPSSPRSQTLDAHKITHMENVSPGCYVPVIYHPEEDAEGALPRCRCMRWGLCRAWEKVRNSPYQLFNARAESVLLKPTFSPLMARGRRCVVPIDGFFEFKPLENKTKQPYYLYEKRRKEDARDSQPLLLAGLWDTWTDSESSDAGPTDPLYSVTLLTMDSCSEISWLHHRQPCIMPIETARRWLDRSCDPAEVLSSMRHACRSPNLAWHRVSNEINKTTYQRRDCATQIDNRKGAITSFFSSRSSPPAVASRAGHRTDVAGASGSGAGRAGSNRIGSATGYANVTSSSASTNKKNKKKRARNSIKSFFQPSPEKKAKKNMEGSTEAGQDGGGDYVILIDY